MIPQDLIGADWSWLEHTGPHWSVLEGIGDIKTLMIRQDLVGAGWSWLEHTG